MALTALTMINPLDGCTNFSRYYFSIDFTFDDGGAAWGLSCYLDGVLEYAFDPSTGFYGDGTTFSYNNFGISLAAGQTYTLYFTARSASGGEGDLITSDTVTFTCPQEAAFDYSHIGGELTEEDFIISWNGGFQAPKGGLADYKIYHKFYSPEDGEWTDWYPHDGYWWSSPSNMESPRDFNLGTNLNSFPAVMIRIDHKFDDDHVTPGEVYTAWDFLLANKPANPIPENEDTEIKLSWPTLTWEAG